MNTIHITQNDYTKLTDLINELPEHDQYVARLATELQRANIVSPKAVPRDVVTMNSQVLFKDVETNNELKYWLVFPYDADVSQGKISVLSPIGCALLGYRKGDTLSVDAPRGAKQLVVEEILHQPEAEGNYE